ncbi:DUF2920 family protein, partial [Campylobacter vulpis]|uniref:DUF2920 family protein n=1 Tax=Campylobacter vulpis TaxID=1655500 RepID=UPI001BD18599
EPVKLLLVLNQGLGDDINNSFFKLIMQALAKKHNAAVIAANYHNIGNRPQTGAKIGMDDFDKNIVEQFCKVNNIPLHPDFKTSEFAFNIHQILSNFIKIAKENGVVGKDFQLAMSATLFPARNEYQNFGIMPALDILNALFYVQKNAPFSTGGGGVSIRNLPVIIAGGSYGGYLASLCAKIAPWAIDGVIDNSGGAKFVERMLGFGKELGYRDNACVATPLEHIYICFHDKTFWTLNPTSPYFFSPARRKIRYILEPKHLEIQANYPKPIYVSYHSIKDYELPLKEKVELYKLYEKLGFDATLHTVRYQKQIDGRFIKNLDHGLGIPFKALVNKHLPEILEKIKAHPKPPYKNKSISYPSDDLLYHFFQKSDKMHLEISRVEDACG